MFLLTTEGFFTPEAGDIFVRTVLRGVIPVLALVLLFVLAMRIAEKRSQSKSLEKTEKMLAEDEAANATRLKDIADDFYYVPNLSALPVRKYSDEEMARPHPCYMWQKKILDIHEKKMLRFDKQYTNVELKYMFGAANLEFVARYEENFTNFIHTMRNWAEALLAADMQDDALLVLKASVDAGSEASQSYTLLADIYASLGETKKLADLKKLVEQRNLPGKKIAISHIEKLLK